MVTMGKNTFTVKNKVDKCPKCHNVLIENNNFFVCPVCGLKISKYDLNLVVYCRACNKLYADINSFNDHILFCKKESDASGRAAII
jgi:hypothetical protein